MIEIRQTDAFSTWIAKLKDRAAKSRINVRIRRMELGNFGDVKSVGGGVSEARINYGPGYRLYFAQVGNGLVVLLCGGNKSTQSLDIAKARKLKKELE